MRWKRRYNQNATFLCGAEELEVARRFPRRRPPWIQCGATRAFSWGLAYAHIANLPRDLQALRILHLSDLHLGSRWMPVYDELIHRLREDPPDLLLFTGDFIENKYDHRPALSTLRRLLPALSATVDIYAILGNHDPQVLASEVTMQGVRLLEQERVIVEAKGGAVELIGLPGCSRWDLDHDFIRAVPPRQAGMPRIVLSHYPDAFPAVRGMEADLFLAGHTHGGQACLPDGWPPLTHDRMPRRFAKGVHRFGRTVYAVSNGFGYSGLQLRVFCPMEVVEFRLARADA
jgi:predicted MPP superfamily phosphohydrolase